MALKEYEVTFKFSDVVQTIEAESKEEAEAKADELLQSDYNPQNDTGCYEIEVEEMTDEMGLLLRDKLENAQKQQTA